MAIAHSLPHGLIPTDLPAATERVPEQLPITGAFRLTELLLHTAPTIERGLVALCEVAPLLRPLGVIRYAATPDGGALHYAGVAGPDGGADANRNELGIAYIVNQLAAAVGHAAVGHALPLESVWFQHARTEGVADIACSFGCPTRFGATDCGFALSKETLAHIPRCAEPIVFEFLQAQARTQLARSAPSDIVGEIMRIVEGRMEHGDTRIEATAASLGFSARTLQRALVAAGTSYRAVLAHARRCRRAGLAREGHTVTTIARKLGFYDVRAMRRSLDGAD